MVSVSDNNQKTDNSIVHTKICCFNKPMSVKILYF